MLAEKEQAVHAISKSIKEYEKNVDKDEVALQAAKHQVQVTRKTEQMDKTKK